MSSVQLGNRLLEVNDLTVAFDGFMAVNKVNFRVEKSEVVSLVGESGSGKTTIARCITRLAKPTSGSIKYKGVEVARLERRALRGYRKDVQMVFQDPYEALVPRLDVFTSISLPIRRLRGESNRSKIYEEVSSLLRDVELDPAETIHKFPHQLSGGEKQRVNIARALASQPALLVADEPVSMLDSALRLEILLLLEKLKSTMNLTMLMITHLLPSAKLFSDRIIVLYRGKVVEMGSVASVLRNPAHPYTELLISAVPHLGPKEQRKEIPVQPSTEEPVRSEGCIFRGRCRYAAAKCAETEPPLVDGGNSHFAACHFRLDAPR